MVKLHVFGWAVYDDLLKHQKQQALSLWLDANQVGNHAMYQLDRDGNVVARRPVINRRADATCCATIADRDSGQEATMPQEKVTDQKWRELDRKRELELVEKAARDEAPVHCVSAGAGGAMPAASAWKRWGRRVLAFIEGAGMVFLIIVGYPAQAQMAPKCMPMTLLAKELATKYGENRVGNAVYQDDGAWRFLYANVRGINSQPSTWTIFDLRSGGMACIVRAGKDLPQWVVAAALGRGMA